LWFTDGTTGSSTSGRIGHIATDGTIQMEGSGVNRPIPITKGFDASIWFANFVADEMGTGIGRIDSDGTTEMFHAPGALYPQGIAASLDGSAWFTIAEGDAIGRMTRGGAFTSFTDPTIDRPTGITLGRDGNMWFANYYGNSIGRITPAGVVTAFTDPGIQTPDKMATAGGDGGMWFTNVGSSTIGRIDTTGAVQSFVLPAAPTDIYAAGTDLWFTAYYQNLIGRVTPAGVVTTFTDPSVYRPTVVATDAAGNVYFGNDAGASVGRMTPGGAVTTYPAAWISPQDMVGGVGDIWFTNGPKNSVTRFGTAG
jgi:virginiamycin B lyase